MPRGYKDKFGIVWYLPKRELCPTCGQPDSCGDCNHKRLTNNDVDFLKGRITEIEYFRRKRG